MGGTRIALVGIGLRYPDATSVHELWDNVLAGRRAFRRLPDERMNHADYHDPNPSAPDRFYSAKAAVLRDWEFDRVRFRIAGSTYRSTDATHWLALDVAERALADAGFPDGTGLPGPTTGVVIGNSLTGEFSRANAMRLRWPYVRRTMAAALAEKGWSDTETAEFLRDMEIRYKSPFPPIGEDSLAGGLANTIAGRLCNHYDLGGGGYTVDGACSSSLLSVATAANALASGDLDVALAGGVDLSIDPFEVIGFAKIGALATGEMKVYDKDSNGFWPGEGAGIVILMREKDALAIGARIYATVTGWGISSDGKGSITRPEADGHLLAIARAYERAGYGVQTVSYFEGHGTGTALGDATEIAVLASARRAADPSARPAALGTIKGNFGHTKAAAGVAGLIKAVLAVHNQVIPPGTGQQNPHPALLDGSPALYVPDQAEPWPMDQPVRAGVSAMGFGGINTHIAIEQASGAARQLVVDDRTKAVVAGRQQAELLLFDGQDAASLLDRIDAALTLTRKLAFAELADLSGTLVGLLARRPVRAAVVARDPEQAAAKLSKLRDLVDGGVTTYFGDGVFFGTGSSVPKIAFLFPGQGSGCGMSGALRRRFSVADEMIRTASLPDSADQVATEVAQPSIVAGALAAAKVLNLLGIEADTAVGHSLGELTALHWGGAMSTTQVLRLAQIRGRVMAEASHGGGTMAGLAAGPDDVERLALGEPVVIAGYNAPNQTVISGPIDAVDRVCAKARTEGMTATRIRVSHAFHSPLVEPAAAAMTGQLATMDFQPLARPVVSTVTAEVLDPATDLRALLRDQVLLPVRFHEAAKRACQDADLVIEVGPGRVLAGLMQEIAPDTPALPTDSGNASIAPLLRVVGAAFVAGVPLNTDALLAGRVIRSLSLDAQMSFLASPCETAPAIDADLVTATPVEPGTAGEPGAEGGSTLDILCRLAAERVELPLDAVRADTHPLDDLHLSSITVGQIVNEVTRELGRPALAAVPNFATVRLGELAELIDELAETARDTDGGGGEAPGVAAWVRSFRHEYVESPPPVSPSWPPGTWKVFAPAGHPMAEALSLVLPGDGVLLCLPDDARPHIGLMLAAGKEALSAERFVVVQGAIGAAGLARTVHLEAPNVAVTVIRMARQDPAAVPSVVAEATAAQGYTEVRFDLDGRRTVPMLSPLESTEGRSPLTADDVILVSGGGKGITAECALALATDSGASLALLGRADPLLDSELAGNLVRLDAAGVRYRYERADVTSPADTATAVGKLAAELGPITAIMHGAGRNEPAALPNLTEEAFHRALAPKVDGLRSVLAAVDPDKINVLITFGSIIGRAGLRGEAHYATANDWLTELTVEFHRHHPRTTVLALEWSVWSGAGMGERLGVVEALSREGITPISVDEGIATLRRLLADPAAGPVVMISGRTGGLPTLPLAAREIPLLRFVDRVLVHYPGIELVAEADLTAGSDPYLDDHMLDGDLLFPAVLGMEAMAQVASVASAAPGGPPVLTGVEFLRPIVVRPGGSTTIRIAALVRAPGVVEVVIRSEETAFGADHFRATLTFRRPDLSLDVAPADIALPAVPVDPVTELYGTLLFQGKRFQRLLAYRKAAARHAVAEVATQPAAAWFATFLPQRQLLADPGARDTAMHALQCCVPDATLLPESVERLILADPAGQAGDYVLLDARERCQDGDSYTYDIDIRGPSGALVERWEGLKLRAVRKRDGAGPWVPALLGSYVERAVERVLGGRRAVVVEPDPVPVERQRQTDLAVGRALGRVTQVRHRPDGKPEVDGAEVSVSHGAGLTLAVAGTGKMGCDVQSVIDYDDWAGLLGQEQVPVRDLLIRQAGEQAAVAGTRVWAALECLRKAGATMQALTLGSVQSNGWVVLSAGDTEIATWVTTVNDRQDPVVFAVLAERER